MPTSPRHHLFFATAALVILASLGWQSVQRHASLLSKQEEETIVNIGIEHDQPLSLRFELSMKGNNAMLQLTSEQSTEEVRINLPTSWERREVRGVGVNELRSEETLFGFTRWYMPPDSSIQFSIVALPTQIIAHNPSGVQLKLTVVTLDLLTEKLEEDIFLILEEPVIINF